MASEIRTFEVTIPPGVTAAAPQVTPLDFPPRIVDTLVIRVPPGPAGAVGFAIAAAGQPIIPYNTGEWLVTDNETITWPLSGYHDSGSWQVHAYNTGTLPHTLYIRFQLSQVVSAGPLLPAIIPADLITPAPAAAGV